MTTGASTLTTTAAGRSTSIFNLRVGQYIWHRGAFRRVTSISADCRRIHMGRYALHTSALTVEVAP